MAGKRKSLDTRLHFEEPEEWIAQFLPYNNACFRENSHCKLRLVINLNDISDCLLFEHYIPAKLYVSLKDDTCYEAFSLSCIKDSGQGKKAKREKKSCAYIHDFSSSDREIIHILKSIPGSSSRRTLLVPAEQFCQILNKSKGRDILCPHDKKGPLKIDDAAAPIGFRISRWDGGYLLKAYVEGYKGDFSILDTSVKWVYLSGKRSFLKLRSGSGFDVASMLEEPRFVAKPHLPHFFRYVAPQLEKIAPLKIASKMPKIEVIKKKPDEIRLYLDYFQSAVIARLVAVFDTEEFEKKDIHIDYIMHKQKRGLYIEYDVEPLLEAYKQIEFALELPSNREGEIAVTGEDNLFRFVYEIVPRLLTQNKCKKIVTHSFSSAFPPDFVIRPKLGLFSGESKDSLELKVSYFSEDESLEISSDVIQSALVSKKRYHRQTDGRFFSINMDKARNVRSILEDIKPDKSGKCPAFHLRYLLEELECDLDVDLEMDGAISELSGKLKEFDKIKSVAPPKEVSSIIRDYQKEGLNWLCFLYDFGFSGILADEMGLGKTLQVLALLRKKNKNEGPSLVLCPTSLVWNWMDEVKKFIPGMSTLLIHGSDRMELFNKIDSHDLIITSYALLRRDLARYLEREFAYIILDESQMIKNPDSLIARSVKKLKSRRRLALSGTPIENNLYELWSVFDFLMKGCLASRRKFRELYDKPISKEGKADVLAKLRRKIHPFVLRRMKKDVIEELPRKIEQVIHGELTDIQAKAYNKMLDFSRNKILEAVGKRGLGKSQITVLTALLRLRQICCHPGLIDPRLAVGASAYELSSKFEALKGIVEKVLANNEKIVVFSQFTRMLDIMEAWIKKNKISYARLDGKTKNRKEVIERFSCGIKKGVFLMSLKAGGVGLNLISASHVLLYDPWWNPSSENQAIDRLHRIGQKKVVNAYRLISINTIEEKVEKLKRKKAISYGLRNKL